MSPSWVAVGVVDQLEVVDMSRNMTPMRWFRRLACVTAGLQAVHEERPIGQFGQEIVEGLEGNRLFGALAVGDVARHARRADEAVGGAVSCA